MVIRENKLHVTHLIENWVPLLIASHTTYPSFWSLLLRLQFGHQRYRRRHLYRVCLVHFELYQQTNTIRRHFKKTSQSDTRPILSISLYSINLVPLERLL